MCTTNRSTLHTVYNIQQSATQGSNDTTHRLSRRTAATTRFSPEGIGCQKQTAPRFCQHPIMWAFTFYLASIHQMAPPEHKADKQACYSFSDPGRFSVTERSFFLHAFCIKNSPNFQTKKTQHLPPGITPNS